MSALQLRRCKPADHAPCQAESTSAPQATKNATVPPSNAPPAFGFWFIGRISFHVHSDEAARAALVAMAQVDEPDDAAGPRDEDEAKVISGVC